MHMNVENFLPAIPVTVDDQTVAIFGNPLVFGNFSRYRKKTAS